MALRLLPTPQLRQTIVTEHGEVIPVIPEVSLESDSESDVSEDSEVFSGRWGSCAMSMGVSLYSGLLWVGRHSSGVQAFIWVVYFELSSPAFPVPKPLEFRRLNRT